MRSHLTLSNARAYAPQLGAAAGVCVGIYGITAGAYHLALGLTHIDIGTAFRWGLATGALCSVTLAGAAVAGYRRTTASPAALQRLALLRLQRSPAARAALGSRFAPGALRAVSSAHGHLAVSSSAARLGWLQPRVSLLFDVLGERGEGMVTVEGTRHASGALVITLLTLDTAPQELLVLEGSEEALRARGALRGFLQGPRVRAIPQDVVLTDDDRLRQQAAMPAVLEDEGFSPREGSGGRA